MSSITQNVRLFIKILAFVAILVVVNLVVNQWDVKWDMTKSGLYSLSEQSRTIARDIDRETELIFFHSEEAQSRLPLNPLWVRTLLKQYSKESPRIAFSEINLNAQPGEAKKYQIRQNNSVVVKVGEQHETLKPLDLINMRRRGESTFKGERAVTNALKNLTTVTERTVWFSTGHGEVPVTGGRGRTASAFRNKVQTSGFSAKTFNPLNDDLPSTDDLIVVLDPQSAFSRAVINRFKQWNADGGHLLIAGNPDNRTAVNALTEPLGGSLERRQILGQNWQFYYRSQGNPFLISPKFETHPVLDPLRDEGLSLLMGRSAPLSVDTGVYDPLLKSSGEAYAKPLKQNQRRIEPRFNPDEDVRGAFTVGAVLQGAKQRGKVVLMGNADLFGDQLFEQAGNKNFAMNLVNWFLERRISLGIEPTPLRSNVVKNISPTQAYTLQIVSLIVVPLVILIWGVVVWWTRKNL